MLEILFNEKIGDEVCIVHVIKRVQRCYAASSFDVGLLGKAFINYDNFLEFHICRSLYGMGS